MIRTYFDTGVLITAFRGKDNDLVKKAYSILDDTNRKFIVSDALKLELFPKPTFNKPKSTSNKQEVTELDFYKRIFDESEFIKISENTISNAFELACKYNLGAMDAIHITLAQFAGVDEFITSEKPTKPMCKITNPKVISLHLP